MNRCGMCFKAKDALVPPVQGSSPVVCKGCFYEIDRVIGYLETIATPYQSQMNDVKPLTYQGPVNENPSEPSRDNPPTPQNETQEFVGIMKRKGAPKKA